jgi:hypothetical protein
MVTIETIETPFAVTLDDRTVSLRPGSPIEVTEAQGLRLLARAKGRLRLVPGRATLKAGEVVKWESPLFGLLSGTVIEVVSCGVTVMHPLTEVPCTIPTGWLR